MFLSRIRIDLSTHRGLSIAANAYDAHRLVFAAFNDSVTARPLYRVESGLEGVSIIVQSQVEPDWNRAVMMLEVGAVFESKPYHRPSLVVGGEYRFKLLANAVKTIDDTSGRLNGRGKAKSVRVPIVGDERLLDWLRSQGDKAGFATKQAIAKAGEAIITQRAKDARTIRLAATVFEGVLNVTDGDALWAGIGKGFGHGKGFGLGLLSIAPTRDSAAAIP